MNGLLTRRRAVATTLPVLVWGDDTMCRDLAITIGRGSILVGGSMGSGKSTVINAILAAACPRPDLCIVGIDPKLVELDPWRDRLAEIACEPAEIDLTLARVYDLMRRRYRWMRAHGIRMWDPTLGAGGWLIVIIDEIADVFRADPTASDHRAAGTEASTKRSMLEAIGSLGRAAGITIVSGTQTPEAKTLGTDFRNNHTTRICLFVPNAHVAEMVLGDVPEGVEPWKIPTDQPGTAWTITGGRARLGRARYYDDRDVARLAAGTAHVRQLAGTVDQLLQAVTR